MPFWITEKFPAVSDLYWNKLIAVGAAPVLPPSVDRDVRQRCSAEIVAGETIESRIGSGADQLARGDFQAV